MELSLKLIFYLKLLLSLPLAFGRWQKKLDEQGNFKVYCKKNHPKSGKKHTIR